MYIDILLVLACISSFYVLWRRISEKMPELELIPDQDLSVLLEENTEKLQRFFLHVFHFWSFYRERHYHEKLRLFTTKLLLKMHILMLRIDNSIVRLMKRLRTENIAQVEQVVDRKEYFSQLQGRENLNMESMNRVEEVRPARRVSRDSRPAKRDERQDPEEFRVRDDEEYNYSAASSGAEKPKATFANANERRPL